MNPLPSRKQAQSRRVVSAVIALLAATCLRPDSAWAAIGFDAVVGNQWGTGTSLSYPHTCTGSSLLLVVNAYSDADNVTGVSYNGVSMTRLGTVVLPNFHTMYYYYLLGPATGTHNVVVTTSSPAPNIGAASASYTGVLQNGQPGSAGTHTDAGATASAATLTTVADNSWAIGAWAASVDANLSWTGGTNRAAGGLFITDSGPVHPAGPIVQQASGSQQNFASIIASFAPDPNVTGPQPTNLVVTNRNGQTFITFSETGVLNDTYNIYQSSSPITTANLPSARLIATGLTWGTGADWYYWPPHHYTITDNGPPLQDGTGLVVWTPDANGSVYYAVTTANLSITQGSNSTTSPIAETVVATPGAVQLGPRFRIDGAGSPWVTQYYAWENYQNWDQVNWPYYGQRFDVVTQDLTPGQLYPLTLVLHGSDYLGYQEPIWYLPQGKPVTGVYIFPRDNDYSDGSNPFCGYQNASYWYGYATNGRTTNITERRVLRYLNLVINNPAFQIDPNRVYVVGFSKGGGGAMHLAYHSPGVFAAAASTIGWVDALTSGEPANPWIGSTTTIPDGQGGFVAWNDWTNQDWLVTHANWDLPPTIYTYASDDQTRDMRAYPNLLADTEATHRGMIAKWQTGGHVPFYLGGNADWFRFKRNEAYPAFSNSGNSDWPGTTDPPALTAVGQRNLNLDWSSSLHSLGIGTDLADAALTFGITLKSLTVDTTATVTIRNAQAFRPRPGQTVSYTVVANGSVIASGNVLADANGLATVTIPIRAAGCRLTFSRTP